MMPISSWSSQLINWVTCFSLSLKNVDYKIFSTQTQYFVIVVILYFKSINIFENFF